MRRLLDLSRLRHVLATCLSGPQMLAFLPAICLAAYWGGGEVLLVLCALGTPLVYAVFGGFGRWSGPSELDHLRGPSLDSVAQDFLEIARHNGQTTACFQIALPDLEQIRHHFGPEAAQEARDLIASRLRTSLRGSDYVFDSGDTRFTVLIAPGFRLRLDNLLEVGKRLRDSAETPLSIAGTTQTLTACIGIASSLNFGRNVTAETWLGSASEALEDAVLTGTGATRLWSDRLSRKHQSRHALQHDIVTALDRGCIQAFYQPQVNVRSGAVIGMEAFARWDHPTQGLLTAAEFLPAMRDSQQMTRLGRTMFLQAVTALQAWDDAGLDVGTVSINLSDDELRDPDLSNRIAGDLDRCGLPAHRLVFDIPDYVIAPGTDDVIRRNLRAMADLGCSFDLEGFGAGGCSVMAVQQAPVTRLKLDKSLVHGVAASEDKLAALHAVLSVSERLDLPALATGVETIEEHGVLRDLGCSFAQGFLFGQPASVADTTVWLTERQGLQDHPSGSQLRRVK
ncbi:MAG: EAL domain-containing protein [Pelagibaca sp.]